MKTQSKIQLPDFKSFSTPSCFSLQNNVGLHGKSELCFGFKISLSERPAKKVVINYSHSNRSSPREITSTSSTPRMMAYANLGPLNDRRINQSYLGLSIGPEHNVRNYARTETTRYSNPYSVPSPPPRHRPQRHDLLSSTYDLLNSTHNSRVKESVSNVDMSLNSKPYKVRQGTSKIRAKSSKGRRGRTPKSRESSRRLRSRKFNKVPASCFPLHSTLKDYVDKNEGFKAGESKSPTTEHEILTKPGPLRDETSVILPPKMHVRGSPDIATLPSRTYSKSFATLPSTKQYSAVTAPPSMRRSYNTDSGTTHSKYLHASPSLNRSLPSDGRGRQGSHTTFYSDKERVKPGGNSSLGKRLNLIHQYGKDYHTVVEQQERQKRKDDLMQRQLAKEYEAKARERLKKEQRLKIYALNQLMTALELKRFKEQFPDG